MIVSTAIGLSGAYAASRDRRRLATALLLAMPSLAARWAFVFVGTPAVRGAALATSIVFYVFTILLILDYVLGTDEVTGDEIYGAVSVYILLGFVWGLAYGLLELARPGSIRGASGSIRPGDFIVQDDSMVAHDGGRPHGRKRARARARVHQRGDRSPLARRAQSRPAKVP